MADKSGDKEFHFMEVEGEEMTKDEFLEERLSYLLEHFSYEELSGLSLEDLNEQIRTYNKIIDGTHKEFMNPDSVYVDKPVLAEWAWDGEVDLYQPLTEGQSQQIISTSNKIRRNFQKAREDAKDRKANRFAAIVGSLPVVSRFQSRKS